LTDIEQILRFSIGYKIFYISWTNTDVKVIRAYMELSRKEPYKRRRNGGK
jgi:hypothetical protein